MRRRAGRVASGRGSWLSSRVKRLELGSRSGAEERGATRECKAATRVQEADADAARAPIARSGTVEGYSW